MSENDELLSVVQQNAQSILKERRRIDDELRSAKRDLEDTAHELASTLARLRATLASTAEGIVVTDNAGRVTDYNDVFVRMWDLSPETVRTMQHQDWERVICSHFTDAAGYLGRVEEIYHTAPAECSDILELADGRVFERFTKIQFLDDLAVGRVWSFRDVSEHRSADAARQHLAAVVDSSDDAIITKDLSGYITTWNDGARRIFGYTADEVIGKSITMLIPAEKRAEEDHILACLRRGDRVLPFETVRVDKAGRRLDISVTASPIKDPHGRVIGASKIARDITLRTRAERMNRFLAESSTALADLSDYESTLQKVARLAVPSFADVCAVDIQTEDGSLRRLALIQDSPAHHALTEEVLRRHPPRPTDRHGAMRVLRTGKSVWFRAVTDAFLQDVAQDEHHLATLRQLRPKSYMCVPVRSHTSAVGALTFVMTDSGREYDEMDLRAAEDLAHRAAIAIENASLVATLRESDRRKDEFLAMLAHELRNPLAPIRNAAHIIRAKAPPGPELTWATEIIERQVHQMTRLVDDLLDVSRITSGKITLHRERVDAVAVVNTVVQSSRQQMTNQGHSLQVSIPSEPLYLNADPIRLSQILSNLLDNAAKYTDRGGQIWLAMKADGGWADIRVKDTGIGIAADMLTRIFDLFTQADRSLDRSQGGLGIGLMLVHRLVGMHGGTVRAISEGAGKGSEFVVRLPRA